MDKLLLIVFGVAFTFIMTTLGSSLVFLVKNNHNKSINAIFLEFASGIMVAASIWSLLLPAIEMSESLGNFKIFPTLIGFILGGVFLVLLDGAITKMYKNKRSNKIIKNNTKDYIKLFIAVTIHNIPEGLAVGFAFGSAANIGTYVAFISALGLAIGIGIQNFPEGLAVALPINMETGNRKKAFWFGSVSGVVEPICAVIAYFLSKNLEFIQPWLLAFAAGTMIFVVIEDLIPESKTDKQNHFGTWGFMLGFAIMMILDVLM